MLAATLLVLGVCSRFMVPWPNFTPVIALALFGGVYLPKKQAVLLPVLFYVIADYVIGFHALILYTWGSMAVIALMGTYLKNKNSRKNIFGASLAAALLYFIVTNFGVWLTYTTYPRTWAGLVECYVAAIPYFRNSLISTVIYTFVLFGSFEWIAGRVRHTRLAFIL